MAVPANRDYRGKTLPGEAVAPPPLLCDLRGKVGSRRSVGCGAISHSGKRVFHSASLGPAAGNSIELP